MISRRSDGLGVIGQRFAHAHENDMGNASILRSASRLASMNLIDDFAGRQIAFETQNARWRKRRSRSRNRLGSKYTSVKRCGFRNQHAFDALAIGETKKKLDRAVARLGARARFAAGRCENVRSNCSRSERDRLVISANGVARF